MLTLSSNFLFIAFFLYFIATILFAVSMTGKAWRNKAGDIKGNQWGKLGFIVAILAFIFSALYFITRWIATGHAPVSNMFEYTTALGLAIGLAFIIIYPIYKTNIVGLFTMPTVLLIIAYASVFPNEAAPLIPALQSNWLKIHVITTVLGQGILAIGFAAGLVYLIRSVDYTKANKKTRSLETILYTIITIAGFILITYLFNALNYETTFSYINEYGQEDEIVYNMPAIVGPNEGEVITDGRMNPLFNLPAWLKAKDVNTLIWSLLTGVVLYWIIRLILRKPIGVALKPLVKNVSLNTVDEVSYRSIAIGYPVFTLGALIFGMIWAQIAWTRFWGWDPKEVWALITFLYYSAYLHLRLSRGWQGEKSAWLCVIGFAIIMFNLIFVNLVIAGLHSYA